MTDFIKCIDALTAFDAVPVGKWSEAGVAAVLASQSAFVRELRFALVKEARTSSSGIVELMTRLGRAPTHYTTREEWEKVKASQGAKKTRKPSPVFVSKDEYVPTTPKAKH